jgi:8-hydroxy-5-deazaflavin:NADPH oxidoreductase
MVSVAFIGIGSVGAAIANKLQLLGYVVSIAARNPSSESVVKAVALNSNLLVKEPATAIREADIVFLATPFPNAVDAIKDIDFGGKILVDW